MEGQQYVVIKRGYISLKWVEYDNKTEELNYQEKRDFILTPNNIDLLLGINPHEPNLDAEGEVCFYSQPEDPITKIFRIQSLPNGDFNLMYADLKDEKELTA